jgi:hypothetical protein
LFECNYALAERVPSGRRPRRRGRTLKQVDEIEAMIASIRLRVTHQDAYEEWEQQTRKDAFVRSLLVCGDALS